MSENKVRYGIVGTSEIVIIPPYMSKDVIFRDSQNVVVMKTDDPCPSQAYVVSQEGTWELNPALDYKERRKLEIEKEVPIHEQLEAITEALTICLMSIRSNDPNVSIVGIDKFAEMMTRINAIKKKYPKEVR